MASRRATAPHADAPPSGGSGGRLGRLWQTPLFCLSLGLFAYAAYLFIDPKPRPTPADKIAAAETLFRAGNAEGAITQLRAVLSTDKAKLNKENEAHAYLLLSEAADGLRRRRPDAPPAMAQAVVEYTNKAIADGVPADLTLSRRLAESYEALGRTDAALTHYVKSLAADPEKSLALQRKVIDLQSAKGDAAAVEASLSTYLKDSRLSADERAWGMGERSRLLTDTDRFVEAREVLDEALKSANDPTARGQINYHLGYCAWKLGDPAEAERLLRIARDLLQARHPVDAEAAMLLGQILQARGEPAEAASFYQDVINIHPGAPVVPMARLGRGVCRILDGHDEEAGLSDLRDVVSDIIDNPAHATLRSDALAGLRRACNTLSTRGHIQEALEIMGLEQSLAGAPTPEFFARLSLLYEKRAAQVETAAADASDATTRAAPPALRSRDFLAKAADAAVAQANVLTLPDDTGRGAALWRAIDLYDRAGALPRAVEALETFIEERPDDGRTPDALLRLGRAYQAQGKFDKAIAAFQRNQFRYPQTLAASKSGVPLAQSYLAKGPDSYGKAEAALMATLESPLITPEAEEFRNALFELAQLFYRTGRHEEAVARLEELTQRYPTEARTGEILFLMADSYRKSAALLKDAATTRPAGPSAATGAAPASPARESPAAQAATRARAAAARKDRLERAQQGYDRVVEYYRDTPPARDLDKLYQRLAHFYRADCLYDTGKYEEAIRLYDTAALRYQDDPSALSAYMQIVNAYCALGRFDEARSANERAKWLLRRMPPAAFAAVKASTDKQYWEDWLRWTSAAAMWEGGK